MPQYEVFGRSFAHRDSGADHGVIRQLFIDCDYNLQRFRRFHEIARFYDVTNRPLIVDCGANIGASPVWFGHTYPKAQVIAVEPDAENFAFIEQNVSGLNVKPVMGAIAGRPGTVQVVDPGYGEWGYRTSGEGRILGEVRAYALGEIVSLAPDHVPFILKIDIEGAEGDLFRDEPEIYAQFPVIIVELHDWLLPRQGTSRSFIEWHAHRDRDFVHLGENIFSFCNKILPSSW